MKHAIVPLQKLMKPGEKVVAECTAGVYVVHLWGNLVGPKDHTLRLIRFDQRSTDGRVITTTT